MPERDKEWELLPTGGDDNITNLDWAPTSDSGLLMDDEKITTEGMSFRQLAGIDTKPGTFRDKTRIKLLYAVPEASSKIRESKLPIKDLLSLYLAQIHDFSEDEDNKNPTQDVDRVLSEAKNTLENILPKDVLLKLHSIANEVLEHNGQEAIESEK